MATTQTPFCTRECPACLLASSGHCGARAAGTRPAERCFVAKWSRNWCGSSSSVCDGATWTTSWLAGTNGAQGTTDYGLPFSVKQTSSHRRLVHIRFWVARTCPFGHIWSKYVAVSRRCLKNDQCHAQIMPGNVCPRPPPCGTPRARLKFNRFPKCLKRHSSDYPHLGGSELGLMVQESCTLPSQLRRVFHGGGRH